MSCKNTKKEYKIIGFGKNTSDKKLLVIPIIILLLIPFPLSHFFIRCAGGDVNKALVFENGIHISEFQVFKNAVTVESVVDFVFIKPGLKSRPLKKKWIILLARIPS
ncbi:MAG: hypothetical protein P1P82_01585 [Bacteroidales bacterium]|nr:hypothetical protein [Bacteroidales bacterium]